MIRNIVGGFLVALGILVAFILLTYGGPVFPHIIGPVTFATIGAAVLLLKKRSPKV